MRGVGVHSGTDATLVVAPGREGITFARGEGTRGVRASWTNVSATKLATVLEDGTTKVSTVEHLMAAFSALKVVSASVTLDAPEVPIMDGSAAPFLEALSPHVEDAGSREAVRVRRPVMARAKGAWAALLPHSGRVFDVEIDFPDPIIGRQRLRFDLDNDDFAGEIAPARTFGRLSDVKALRRRGYAKGASLENAIAVDGARVANPEGLRFPDEFVRHKLLDAIGDLALAERPILGCYRSFKAGHRLNYALLAALFGDRSNYALVS